MSAIRIARRRSSSHRLPRSLVASLALVALTMLLVGVNLADSVAVGAAIEPTPTEQPEFIAPLQPFDIVTPTPTLEPRIPDEREQPTVVPTTDADVPTEDIPPPTDEIVPTEDVIPTETVGADEAPPETGNSIYVFKRFCPEGFDQTLDYASFVLSCSPGGPVGFTLVDGTGVQDEMTDDGGLLQWHNVTIGQEGELQIIEAPQAGFGEPVVFCGNLDEPLARMDLSGTMVIPMPGASPFNYQCFWFNIPEGAGEAPPETGNSISIFKRYCPADVDLTLDVLGMAGLCPPGGPVGFTLVDGNGVQDQMTDDYGVLLWENVSIGQEGELQIIEAPQAGYGEPVVFCESSGTLPVRMDVSGTMVIPMPGASPFDYQCFWFNIPEGGDEPGGGDVRLIKYACPAGTVNTDDFYALGETCLEEIAPVTFSITATGGGYAETKTADPGVPQQAVFGNVPYGEIAIEEVVPAGYQWPLVFCSDTPADGPGAYYPVEPWSESGAFILDLRAEAEMALTCLVFNIPGGGDEPGADLTIVKYTCPDNYDRTVPGADPWVDCPTLTDGVVFILDDGTPAIDLGGVTGEGGTGVVTFFDVAPGLYTVHEVLDPGMGAPFVLECDSNKHQLQPYPLAVDNDLPILLGAGDIVTCYWFNVPAGDPDLGTLTLTKHICTTDVFVSDVDCGIYEGGQTFDLLSWDGVQWTVIATATTDVTGRIVWIDLPIGHYRVAEQGGTWCHLESSAMLANDESFNLNHQGGMDPTVDVWNCGADPMVPGETPKTYPNTGVGDSASATRLAASEERRLPASTGDTIQPLMADSSSCLPADDPAVATGDAACPRGAVPATIRIDAIGVDAPIEIRETVGGAMQQPSGETAVAWYKDSARLGESGNMLFAGHLNWWGIPEAVFFSLGELREGDEIVVTDASGASWTYRVSWVRQEDSLAPASAEVLGPTETPAITLITCGGDWNADAGLYDERTVVRAVLVEGPNPQ